MSRLYPLTTIILMLLSSACTRSDGDYKLPGVYRIDIQQGNVIEQDMIDRLKPGMEKHQVRFIMGTPTIIDPFHPDRWDYIYTYTRGATKRHQRRLTIYFEEEKLAYLEGDIVPSERIPPESLRRSKTVDVPTRQRRQSGLFGGLLDKVPFIGDDKKEPAPVEAGPKKADPPVPQEEQQKQAEPATDSVETVNTEAKKEVEKKGFFSRLLNKLPIIGNDDEDEQENAVADAKQ